MKTRRIYTESNPQQGGGCCGTTPVQVQPKQAECCVPQVEETTQTGGGCC